MKKKQENIRTSGSLLIIKKKSLAWLVLVILLLIVVMVKIAASSSAQKDSQRFAVAEKQEKIVSEKFSSALGSVINEPNQRNVCYYTEQGPYDKGKLWCQVSTIYVLKKPVDFLRAGQELVAGAKAAGFATSQSVSGQDGEFWFYTGEGIKCSLSGANLGHGLSANGSAMKLPFDVQGDSQPMVAISCADRAKAKHYQLVD